MTGRVLPFDASTHASADALLPFYVNGTLRGAELAFVEQHVRACDKCQHEVAWLRKMFADLAADQALQGPLRPVTGSASLQSLEHRRIRNNWGVQARQRLRATPAWTRWLLAAQLAAIAVLGTIVANDTRDIASYRTLGAPNASTQAGDTLAVMFDPGTTESAMRQIVLGAGARIVDGPTRTGIFVLQVPAERAAQALETLRAEPAVRLAERLGPGVNR